MKTYIVKESKVENYRKNVIMKHCKTVDETRRIVESFGYKPVELEDAKWNAAVGDCLLIRYGDTLMPFQIVDKRMEDGKLACTLQSYYLLENWNFPDSESRQSDSLRRYLNSEDGFLKKLDPELVKLFKNRDSTHNEKVWIPDSAKLDC